ADSRIWGSSASDYPPGRFRCSHFTIDICHFQFRGTRKLTCRAPPTTTRRAKQECGSGQVLRLVSCRPAANSVRPAKADQDSGSEETTPLPTSLTEARQQTRRTFAQSLPEPLLSTADEPGFDRGLVRAAVTPKTQLYGHAPTPRLESSRGSLGLGDQRGSPTSEQQSY